jgi:PAS domain S-box-containing protein
MWRDGAGSLDESLQGEEGVSPGRDMLTLVNTFDWASTPLGEKSTWPDPLKTIVRMLLSSKFAMWMAWGPELTFLYNDAYHRSTLAQRHPWALGKRAQEVWPEIWPEIGPRIERVLETGDASWDEGLLLFLERSGYPEETYHTFSYSPLTDNEGRIHGMLCVVSEETVRVINQRQLSTLSSLSSALADAITEREVAAAIEHGLSSSLKDMPFTLTYLFDESGSRLELISRTGIEAGHPAAPQTIDIHSRNAVWPIDRLLAKGGVSLTLKSFPEGFSPLPSGEWDRPPSGVHMVSIAKQGQDAPAGVLIAALNPYRVLDEGYERFLNLIAGQIAAGIGNAKAYEEERRRAESLAELDRAKTAFFSNVSHELRTPLTLILGPLADAIDSHVPPSWDAIDMLNRNALRLLKLVNALLDFARMEAGRSHATYQPTDLSRLTAELASVFRSAIERGGLRLIVDCPPLPELVFVDREMWEKIVLNLLSNALKSTFHGDIEVKVRATEAGAQLAVRDTGTGIAEEELTQVFGRFKRIEGAARRSHEGSGIGLALVRELVEMHGGRIYVTSKLGEGSTFFVDLPFGSDHLVKGRVHNESQSSMGPHDSAMEFLQEALGWLPGTSNRDRERKLDSASDAESRSLPSQADDTATILLADDNADMRGYLHRLLKEHFRVVSAEDGRAAFETALSNPPDLVLTDVMMPEMDGFQLLAALRANPSTRTIPVIMLSARAGEEARIEGLEATADDYLTKPFTSRELIARVDAHLKMARLRQQAAEHEAALTNEVRKAQRLAGETLEHIPDAYFMFDREFRILHMNPAAEELMAGSDRPPLGELIWDLYPTILGTEVEDKLRRTMEERVAIEFEHCYQPWGRWLQHRIYPNPGEGIVLFVRDTTEARKTEEALRRSEQLAAAGRLAVSISHEINNPLEALTNLLYLAKAEAGLPPDTRELLEVADRELQRLSHIAARSLKFYRQRTAPAYGSLEEILEQVVYFHEPRIKAGAISVERRYRNSPNVFCYSGEVQQVFTNLISNALDALAKHGRLVLRIRPGADCKSRRGLYVTVADSGAGMDQQTLDQLFHPFFTTKGEEGTGLGLWVSKGIIDKHEARIEVRSRPATGTVFRVFFPVNAEESLGT